jgi:hypothetical protein
MVKIKMDSGKLVEVDDIKLFNGCDNSVTFNSGKRRKCSVGEFGRIISTLEDKRSMTEMVLDWMRGR